MKVERISIRQLWEREESVAVTWTFYKKQLIELGSTRHLKSYKPYKSFLFAVISSYVWRQDFDISI